MASPGRSTLSQNDDAVTTKETSTKEKGMGLSAATEHARESAQQCQGLVLGLGFSTRVELHWRTPDKWIYTAELMLPQWPVAEGVNASPRSSAKQAKEVLQRALRARAPLGSGMQHQ